MGQIAACLTDLICLIEQRDAFGFTSPSKAADSASVKKKSEEKRKREKSPHTLSSAINTLARIHTHTDTPQLLEGLFISFKHLIHCPTTQALSGHQPPTKDRKPGKSVNCQYH